ncbi:endogenous retrovirus group K member 6 Pro protein-like [Oryctolagus cuniculus]|uniref:endogenous retrovirus group K member 6 Pro protein-like n=1 Tax=Oryctolagus cuniculus TaxID=9986 RepID=UPI003879EB7D
MPIFNRRPKLTLYLDDIAFVGLIDTGADVTVLKARDARKIQHWKRVPGPDLQGVRGLKLADQVITSVIWQDESGDTGTIFKLIAEVSMTLWARDVLSQMKAVLTMDHKSPQASSFNAEPTSRIHPQF